MNFLKEWKQRLDHKRFRPTSSTGTPSGWNPFDSDYARIAMSAPFRRLQDKAQVFPLEPNDFVRTRLTHSLEVSSVARSLGVDIENWLLEMEYIPREMIGYIPSILATASIAHDIGNPPFGHFGEGCIRTYFSKKDKEGILFEKFNEKEKADLLHFDGNVQGLRLLLRLGLAKDEFSYNLTFPVLATVIKYPKDSITGNKKGNGVSFKKYGYYQNDKDKYEEINEVLGLSNERHPLCFILESADDICYSVSDIEDGVKKQTVNIDFLIDTLSSHRYYDDNECKELLQKIKKLLTQLSLERNCSALIAQECRIFSQRQMIYSCINRFKENHESILNGNFKEELLQNSPSFKLRKFFGEIANKNFNHSTVVKSEIIGERVLTSLLERFITAALSDDCGDDKTLNGKLYSLISNQSKNAFEISNYQNVNYLKMLMVIDFIASMTDSYALTLYRELNGVG